MYEDCLVQVSSGAMMLMQPASKRSLEQTFPCFVWYGIIFHSCMHWWNDWSSTSYFFSPLLPQFGRMPVPTHQPVLPDHMTNRIFSYFCSGCVTIQHNTLKIKHYPSPPSFTGSQTPTIGESRCCDWQRTWSSTIPSTKRAQLPWLLTVDVDVWFE